MGDIIRYRISVPKEDISIQQWMDCQANISHSIRTIIRAYIQENGYTDATCQPVKQNLSTQTQINQSIFTETNNIVDKIAEMEDPNKNIDKILNI